MAVFLVGVFGVVKGVVDNELLLVLLVLRLMVSCMLRRDVLDAVIDDILGWCLICVCVVDVVSGVCVSEVWRGVMFLDWVGVLSFLMLSSVLQCS